MRILRISQQRVSQHTYPIYTCRTQTRCDEREGEQRERREGRTQRTHQRGYTPYPTRSTSRDTPPRRPATGGGYAPRLALEVYPRGVRRGHPHGDIPLETRLRRYTPPEIYPSGDWSPRLVLGYWSQTRPPAPPPPGTGTAPRHRPRHRHRTTLLGLAPRRGCRPVPGVVRYRHTQRTRPSDRNTTCRPSPTCS